MKRRMTVVGGAIIIAATIILNLSGRSYTYYMPLAPQTGHATAGIAWAPGWTVDLVRDDFGLYRYSHSASHAPTWLARGGIPYIRPGNEAAAVSGIKAAGYCGWVIFLNEPDRPDQDDLTPAEAAAMYARVRPQLACNRFAIGNSIDPAWLEAFLELARPWPGDVVGIHIYQNADPGDAEFVWPSAWIDAAVRLAQRNGMPASVAVTEFGMPNRWSDAERAEYLAQVRGHPRVVLWLLYTSHCGGYNAHACQFNLYDEVAQPRPPLTANGRLLSGYP